jgi:transcriptional regulator with XRE-family HTH domain
MNHHDYKALRLQLALSQNDAAIGLGVDIATIQKRERGLVRIRPEHYFALERLGQITHKGNPTRSENAEIARK